MTHSIDAPLPPPTTTGAGRHATSQLDRAATATKDVAMDEAKNVGQTAAQAGSQVASDRCRPGQGGRPARPSARPRTCSTRAAPQLKDQAVTQQQKAAQGLTSLAQELRGLADGTSQGAPGPARDLLQQASGYGRELRRRAAEPRAGRAARRGPQLRPPQAGPVPARCGCCRRARRPADQRRQGRAQRHRARAAGGYTRADRTTSTPRRPTRTTPPRLPTTRAPTAGTYADTGAATGRRPAAAAAVRHRAARGQRGAAGHPGRLGRPGPAPRWGGLTMSTPYSGATPAGAAAGLRGADPSPSPRRRTTPADYSGTIGTPTTETGRPDVEGTSVGAADRRGHQGPLHPDAPGARAGQGRGQGRGEEGRPGRGHVRRRRVRRLHGRCCSSPSPCGGPWRNVMATAGRRSSSPSSGASSAPSPS